MKNFKKFVSPGRILRELMNKDCIMMVGAFNGLVGRLLAKKGFNACYVSGAAVSASSGQPDIGFHIAYID